MGRGGRTGSKRSNNNRVWKKSMDSEDSDEDYVAEADEIDEQSDELESLVADASEEDSFFEAEEEEEEDEEEWRAVVKPRARKGSTKSRNNRSKKDLSHFQEEDDEEEEEWREVEKPRGRKGSTRSRNNGVMKEESCFEEEEEEDEEDEDEDDEEEEEEWRTAVKPRVRKGSTRSRNNGIKKEESCSKEEEEEEEEEEEKEVDEEEQEEEEEGWRTVVKPSVRKGSTRSRNYGIRKEESFSEEEEEEEEEEQEEDEEEEWKTVVKPRARKGPVRSTDNGIRRPSKRRKLTCDDDEESDDDDEEFTPDEIDSLEDEDDFPQLSTKSKKRGRTSSKRKRAKTQRRKTSKKAIKKLPKKRSKKTGNLRRKAKSADDEDSSEQGPTLRGRSKKKSAHRKKKVKAGSDSDCCSDPSDYEFTISEEEREQIKEANEICRSLTTNLRSSRRCQEDEAICELSKPPVRKGKEKAEETKNDAGKPVCGICLTEEGKTTIRGTLNCCSHYFCFACIMEWSKVESRCPLCKQRFVTITKHTRCGKGFDLRTSVVAVPERDQVYQPSEEELRDFLNPYENVICTECHQGGDDALMLLCDLCDSPAHTYCVGLGREVPEGNWYCDGCRPAALGSSNFQAQDLTPDQRTSVDASYGASTYENMAEIDLNVTIPETPVSQGNGFLSSPRYTGGSFQAPSPVSGMGVSTVFGRRRIHRQIRHILSNRLNQLPQNSDYSTLRSLLGGEANSTLQQSRTSDVGTSHHTQHVDRLQEYSPHYVQNRDFFPGRPGCIVGQAGQASSSTDGSSNSQVRWSGLDGINYGPSQTQISSGEQLRPCTSRSSIGFGVSPSHNRDDDHVNIVKQHVLLIVNSQLKTLSQEISLDHDTSAIISRRATDAIMVAYQLEPPRNGIHEVRLGLPFCLHTAGRPNVEISPMNDCCLSCFEKFAKDVVKRMMDMELGPTPGFRFRY